MIRFLSALLVLIAVASVPAHAHERSRSSSSWVISETGVTGYFLLDARQATLFLSVMPPGTTMEGGLRTRLIAGIEVSRAGTACELDGIPEVRLLSDGRLRGAVGWTCSVSDGPVMMDIQVFSPFSPNHVHFVQARFGDEPRRDYVLARGRTTIELDAEAEPESLAARAGHYLLLGIEHILAGPDHLAFLAGLLLVVGRFRDILLVTLGFTVGHSITLALAYLGWVSPPGAMVEALIGFSILFVAGEAALKDAPISRVTHIAIAASIALLALANIAAGGAIPAIVWLGLILMTASYAGWLGAGGRAESATPALSAGFGLVHGVGFAGILLELELPPADRIPALLGFNIGVETGQLIFVGSAALVLLLLRRIVPAGWLNWGRMGLIALLAGLGAYWFIERAWG